MPIKIKIVIDERETAIFSACTQQQSQSQQIEIEKRVLDIGDILIDDENNVPQIIIERKSLSDLVASIKDGRYEEQSHRLQHASHIPTHNIMYIVEGMFSQLRSPQDKKMVLSAMTSLQFFKGFSVIRTCSVTETTEFILNMADKISRDLNKGKIPAFSQKDLVVDEEKEDLEERNQNQNQNPTTTKKYCEVVKKVKKENITKENMGEIILCQIPGISSITAIAIMNYVENSLPKLLDILKNSPEELQSNIKTGENGKQRKISQKNVENMIYFLL
jgi:ERCC4-type nuclease